VTGVEGERVASIAPEETEEGICEEDVTYMPPCDRQTARCKEKARAEEWIKSEDGITETMTGPNGVYTRFVSTSPPESEQDDAAAIGFMQSHE